MNIETAKVNVTTVVSIVVACFAMYFFVAELVSEGVREAKIYAITLDIERDESVVSMYRFRIDNDIASPNDQSRMETLQGKIAQRIREKELLEAQ